MQRLLPPLLLLLILAVVAVRCAQEPSRAESRIRITGLVQGRQLERAREDLGAYLERFDEEEDRWYAARTYLRMGRPIAALDAIWKHPVLPSRPETARRFAEAGLFALGWRDEERLDTTQYEPRALIILAEGGHPWAQARLRQHAAEDELLETTLYFFPAYRMATRIPLEILTTAFRERGLETFDVAAALGSLGAEPYAGRERDLANLVKVVTSNDWRRRNATVWTVACLALGRSGDPRGLVALEQTEARLEGSSNSRDRTDLLLVRIGLLAAGKWKADESLAAHIFGPDPILFHQLWYLEALIHRYRLGDMRSELGLRRMWEGPGARFQDVRLRIARAHLLQENPPDDKAREVWVPRMLRDLQAPDQPLISHALARAYLLRSGAEGGREAVLDTLRMAGETFLEGEDNTEELIKPFLEALRALYLYG